MSNSSFAKKILPNDYCVKFFHFKSVHCIVNKDTGQYCAKEDVVLFDSEVKLFHRSWRLRRNNSLRRSCLEGGGTIAPERDYSLKLLAPSSIHDYSILVLIIMKDEGPNVFKLVKTNSASDFLKNNTSSTSAWEGIIFDKIQGIMF